MIPWIIAMLAIVSYLAVGQVMAKLHAPRAWRAARREYSFNSGIRESVRNQTFSMMFAWPIYQASLIVIFIAMRVYGVFSSRADNMINQHDPEVIRLRELEYRAQINSLEREAGMEPTKWPK